MNSNPDPNRISRLISSQEAADYLGVSTSMIDKLVKAQEITVIKVGVLRKFTYENLDAYIERNTTQAKAV